MAEPFTVLAKLDDLERDEFLALRLASGFGASDSGAILGVSPYRSAYDVCAERLGILVPDPELSEADEAGVRLEGVVRDWTAERMGLVIEPWPVMLQSTEHPFMCASPDGRAFDTDGNLVGGYEGKAPGLRQAEWWADGEVPLWYQAQCQQSMGVTGYDRWICSALLGGQQLLITEIERDQEVIDALVEREGELWELVKAGQLPDIDGHPATTAAVKAMWPEADPGSRVELVPDFLELIERRSRAKEMAKAAEQNLDAIENEIKAILGDRETATVGGRPVLSWKTVRTQHFDIKAHAEAHPDCAEAFTYPSSHRRLHVPKSSSL